MEKNKKSLTGNVCESCGMGGGYWGGHHSGRYVLLRWILGVAILAIVFSIGVKVGEFKAIFGGYGYGGYDGYGGYGTMMGGNHMLVPGYSGYYGPNMMWGLYNSGIPKATVPAATSSK